MGDVSLSILLAMTLRLHPSYRAHPPPRAPDYAAAIASVTDDRDESVELLAIAHAECGLRVVPGCVPFGVTAWARHHRGPHTLAEYAGAAVRTIRMATRQCGPSVEQRMAFYVRGDCRVDREARRRARIVRRLYRAD